MKFTYTEATFFYKQLDKLKSFLIQVFENIKTKDIVSLKYLISP